MPELGIPGLTDVEQIGAGGFGTVYRAREDLLDRTVAVKLLSGSLAGPDDERRFERERRATGALSNHPNIVTVHGSGVTGEGRPYILMEYLARGSLAARLASDGPLPWEEAAAIGVKLAGALETAHQAGILHRDIKPENVLMSDYGEPLLADFGIARIEGATATRSGVITASLVHAPPEILNGDEPTVAADVYGLASTVFTLVAGSAPFDRNANEGLPALIARITTSPPPDLRERGVPDPVATVIERGLAKDPRDRPYSAREWGELLQAAQAAEGTAPTPLPFVSLPASPAAVASPSDDVNTTPRRRRTPRLRTPQRATVNAFAAGVLVLGLVGAAFATMGNNNGGMDASGIVEPGAFPHPSDDEGVAPPGDLEALGSPSPGMATPSPGADLLVDGFPAAPGGATGNAGPDYLSGPPSGSGSGSGTSPSSPTGGTTDSGPTGTTDTSPTGTTGGGSTGPSGSTDDPPPPTQANRAPTAYYVTSVRSGTNEVKFDASNSSDPDGDALSYTWTFADGTAAKSGKVVTHRFTINNVAADGRYVVTLRVKDGRGGEDVTSTPAQITMPNLRGMDGPVAHRAARGAGLDTFYSPAYDPGTSFTLWSTWSQWPAAGTKLGSMSKVRLVIWDKDTCDSRPDETFAHWWCFEPPPPSPTLDRSYL